MAQEKGRLAALHLRDTLPWLRLFRAFGIAFDFKKVLLGAVGVVMMSGGWWLLARAFIAVAPSADAPVARHATAFSHMPWEPEYWGGIGAVTGGGRLATLGRLLADPLDTIWGMRAYGFTVLRPVQDFVRPFSGIFRGSGFVASSFSFLCGLWAIAVWSFFGGAITRVAAAEVAQDRRIGLGEAMRYARGRYLSYLAGPLVPFAFIAVCTLFCLAGGALNRIPWGVGETVAPLVAGLLWFLPMLAGFAMLVVAIGWAAGWPLMFATISVEGSDTFDAVSRSWAYSVQRPWNYLFYILTAVLYGSFCMFFIWLCADLLVYLSGWAVSIGSGDAMIRTLTSYAPLPGWRLGNEPVSGVGFIAATAAAGWLYLLFFLVLGFIYSYFWSVSTIIYYLLRRDVDGIEIDEVFVEQQDLEEEGDDPLSPIAEPEPEPAPAAGEPPPEPDPTPI